MDYRILNNICYFLHSPENLLSCCKQFTVKRFRNIRWKNRVYLRDNKIKIINCENLKYQVYICKELWCKNGKAHFDEIDNKTGLKLPAKICSNGSKYWYKDGKQHRDDIDPDTGVALPAEI
jgi:hypothetical protein